MFIFDVWQGGVGGSFLVNDYKYIFATLDFGPGSSNDDSTLSPRSMRRKKKPLLLLLRRIAHILCLLTLSLLYPSYTYTHLKSQDTMYTNAPINLRWKANSRDP